MSILVTGCAGYIGSIAAKILIENDFELIGIDNLSTGFKKNLASVAQSIKFVEGDILKADLLELLQDVDIVFHLAAISSVQYSIEKPTDVLQNNVMTTSKLLEAARIAKVKRFVFISSAAVYGDAAELPVHEHGMLKPLSPYALSKVWGEQLCLHYWEQGLETVSLRLFNVYGPRQNPTSEYSGVISKFVAIMREGKQPKIFGDGSQTRDFVAVQDTVRGIILAAEAPLAAGRTFNIATGTSTSILDLVSAINNVLQTQIAPVHIGPKEGDIKHSLADIRLATSLLSHSPALSFLDGLHLLVKQK